MNSELDILGVYLARANFKRVHIHLCPTLGHGGSIGITLLLLLLLLCSLLRSGQGEVLRAWMEGPRVTSTAIPSRGGAREEKKLMDGWCLNLDILYAA